MAIRNGRYPEMDKDMVRPIWKHIEVHKRTALELRSNVNTLTISLGGIIMVYCAKIADGFTMQIPLQILEGLAADFDRITVRV